MKRSPNRFNQREVARAYRAITRAGGNVDRVEIEPDTGRIIVILKTGETKSIDGTRGWQQAIDQLKTVKTAAKTRA